MLDLFVLGDLHVSNGSACTPSAPDKLGNSALVSSKNATLQLLTQVCEIVTSATRGLVGMVLSYLLPLRVSNIPFRICPA
jgi:hypothetical protein